MSSRSSKGRYLRIRHCRVQGGSDALIRASRSLAAPLGGTHHEQGRADRDRPARAAACSRRAAARIAVACAHRRSQPPVAPFRGGLGPPAPPPNSTKRAFLQPSARRNAAKPAFRCPPALQNTKKCVFRVVFYRQGPRSARFSVFPRSGTSRCPQFRAFSALPPRAGGPVRAVEHALRSSRARASSSGGRLRA